jgi:FkbM family methyltransferase
MPLGDGDPAPARRRGLPGAFTRLADLLRPRRPLLPLSRLSGGGAEAMVRALAGGIPLAEGVLLCRSLGRHKLLLDAADHGHAPHLLLDGFWEWWTTVFLARNLRPGETVVDAGAGYGYFTLLAADLVGPAGRVLAFEPEPRVAGLLRRSLTLNGFEDRVELRQAALAMAAQRSAPFGRPPGRPLDGRLLGADEVGETAVIPVETVALDAFADRAPDLVKLDIPGAEETAWDGMQRLLEARPAMRLLLSFDPTRCRAPAALLAAIAARFPLRRVDPDGVARGCTEAALLEGGEAMLYLARGGAR